MLVLRAAITEDRAAILRLVQLPRPMAVVAVVQALVLLLVLSAAWAAVSVLKVRLHPQQPPMVRAGAATAALLLVSIL